MIKPLQPKRKSRNPQQLRDRLAMLANGWFPMPAEAKSKLLEGWNKVEINEDVIKAWDGFDQGGSKLTGTGTRLQGEVFALDLDIKDPVLMDAVLEAIETNYPDFFSGALWRHSGDISLALFSRASKLVGGCHSGTFGRIVSVNDDGSPKEVTDQAHVETYGGGTNGKYFMVFGPHAVAGREYGWHGGASPVNTELSSLPVFDADEIPRLIDIIEAVLTQFLTRITKRRIMHGLRDVYTLTQETPFWLADGTETTVGALDAELATGVDNGVRGLLSLEDWHVSTSKAHCVAFKRSVGDGRLMITDFYQDINYHWVDEELPDRSAIDATLGEQMRLTGLVPGAAAEEPPAGPLLSPPPRSIRLEDIQRDESPELTYAIATAWLLKNIAVYAQAFNGRGGAISIHPDGEFQKPVTLAALRSVMSTFEYETVGPRGGVKRHNPVDYWAQRPERIGIHGVRMRPDMPRPWFYDDGLRCLNRYVPPSHPEKGGSITLFKERLMALVPNEAERWWVWNWMACLVQHPEWRMIALAMLARDMGSGRGLFAEVLQLLLGERFVTPIPYASITGGSKFNAEVEGKLLIYVNESHSPEDHKYHTKNAAKEALKVFIEPNHRIPFRVEPKGIDAYFTRASVSTLLLTNNVNGLPVGDGDRRLAIVVNGPQMTTAERDNFQVWMVQSENIGALYRLLRDFAIEQDRSKFDPYMAPAFDGRDLMIEANKTELDLAWEAAIAKLDTAAELATMTQIVAVTRYFARSHESGFDDLVKKHTVVNGYRIGVKRPAEKNWRIRYVPNESKHDKDKRDSDNEHDNRERVYAFNSGGQTTWTHAELEDIRGQLDKAQRVVDEPGRRFSRLLHSIDGGKKSDN